MADTLIQAFMGLLSNFVNLFVEPFFNALSSLPGMSWVNTFVSGCITIFTYAYEGGVFVKQFLLIPSGIMLTFFTWLVGLTVPWLTLKTNQFVLRVYNLLKGLI